MPTVSRINGYRFYFYSHEPNEPPHIHVDKAGASLKAWLDPVTLAKNIGFRRHEIHAILQIVMAHQQAFLETWHEYFD